MSDLHEEFRKEDLDNDVIEDEIFMKFMSDLHCALSNAEANSVKIVDPNEMRKFSYAYQLVKRAAISEGGSVSCKISNTSLCGGSISVVGKNVIFTDTEGFCDIGRLASNFEAYPLANGNIKITFTFNKLTKLMNKEV